MSAVLSGREIAGFLIGERLATGGFAHVYEATRDGQLAVLKVGRESGGSASATRSIDLRPAMALQLGSVTTDLRTAGSAAVDDTIRSEAALLRADGGELLPRLLAEAELEGRPVLVLERLAGDSLRERLVAKADPDPQLLLAVLKKLAAEEGRLVFHGDLKPEHVFAEGVRLIDPAYRSDTPGLYTLTPEYNPLFAAGPMADVIAVAAMLYESYVGSPPFVDAPPAFALRLIPNPDEEQRYRSEYAATVPRLSGRDGVPAGVASFVDDAIAALILDPRGGEFASTANAARILEERLGA